MECISLEPHGNWALKLANLKKLKKALISYLDQELKVPYKRFDSIELSNIARKEDPRDMLSLLELVVYSIVNSPYKEEFIKKIMELDEDCQTQFMFFIQKVLGEGDSPLFDPKIKVENREVLILRTDKQRIAVQLQDLLEEHKSLKAANQKITSERDELKLIITDLKSEMTRKLGPASNDFNADSNELELRLTEKEVKVMQLTNQVNELKNSSEKEIARLRDELDVANAKIFSLSQNEKTLQQYKKRVETLSSVKIKLQEVQKHNDALREQIEMKDLEIENISSLKRNIKVLKDDLTNERKNSDNLTYKLENLKKEMKKKETEIEDAREKLVFSENRLKEVEFEQKGLDSPQNSEDSCIYNKLSEIEDSCKTPLDLRRDTRRYTGYGEVEQARKDKLLLQHKLNKSKEKSKSFKESALMVFEEMYQRNVESTLKIKQLEGQLLAISTQLQVYSQNLSDAQNEKFKYEQSMYEIEQMKNNKEVMMNEVRRLYEEKDHMYKRYIEGREESMGLQGVINEKEVQLRQKEITEKILNERVLALTEKERVSVEVIESLKKQKKEVNEDYRIKFIEVEREAIALKSEKSALLFRLAEKEERIEEVLKDKSETIRILEQEHHEVLDRLKQENNWRTKQIIVQCDEAISELQKERELVQAQLKFEKKNTLQEWKKSMSIEWMQNNKEEMNKLKEEISKKDKEILKLTKTNQEIKKCWKDSTRLLKSVWKELGTETQKIQQATKRYN